jgi:hypothetical protein
MQPVQRTRLKARRTKRWLSVAVGASIIATAAACAPAPPPTAYWGPYGSRDGVMAEAKKRSDRLEQHVKNFLDGTGPAAIPADILPEVSRDLGNWRVLRPEEVTPEVQWITRAAHTINPDAAIGQYNDPHASYALMPQFLVPFGSKVTFKGFFPHARYFSIQPTPSFYPDNYRYGYAGLGDVAFVDADIKPNWFSQNPYRPGADRNAPWREYTLTCDVVAGDPTVVDAQAWTSPDFRAPDTNNRKCGGMVYRGPWGDPNFTDANFRHDGDKKGLWDNGSVWMRIYAPDKNTDAFGGVPLPKVMYTLPDGRDYYITADTSGLEKFLNARTALEQQEPADMPASAAGTGWTKQFDILGKLIQGGVGVLNYPFPDDPAAQRKYVHDLTRGVTGRSSESKGAARLEPHATGAVHINYLVRSMCLGAGKVFTVQGQLPTTPKTRNGEATMTSAQARYWSLTGYSVKFDTNNPQAVTGAEITSVMDDEIVVDANNRYILMYGRPQDRPANATAANGVTWIDWGREACQGFTLRWMNIGPEWTMPQAPTFDNAGWETDPPSAEYDPTRIDRNNRNGALGNYQPTLGYLTPAQFEQLGNGRIDPFSVPLW